MNRRSFFATLLAPLVAKFRPAKAVPMAHVSEVGTWSYRLPEGVDWKLYRTDAAVNPRFWPIVIDTSPVVRLDLKLDPWEKQ